jgi:hypothetical protein
VNKENIFIKKEDQKYGFKDQNNELITAIEFDDISYFNEGLAAVKKNNKWDFINNKGVMVIQPQF